MKKYLPVCCFFVIISICPFINADMGSYEMKLPITSKESLMRIGTIPLFVTENGKKAAAILWNAVEKNNPALVKKTIPLYEGLLQKECKTGDYGSLKWLCECIAASEEEKKNLIPDQLSEDFYRYFTDNNYANLKEYLLRKYKVNDFNPEDVKKHLERRTYLEDLIMFNNPRRGDWEKSDEIMKYIKLNEGDSVIDVGCGFGFYSYRFSRMVGRTGKVWAVDTSEPYINYINEFVKKYKISNILPVTSKISDISVKAQADVVFMCSVYHIIYGWSREADRVPFIASVKRSLKQGGLLVIADNSFANGDELNSCYLNKELAIAQLTFYGFRFIKYVQITPQRYLLIFKNETGQPIDSNADKNEIDNKMPCLKITSGNSVIHIGSLDSYDITEKGIEAAKLVYDALKNKNMDAAKKAVLF
jgi:ubiquinone/menaquinone biosynthesis C-methylase UbiE